MPATHTDRRDRLRARLAELDAPAALVTRLVNVRYLTGFTGSNAALLVRTEGPDVLATDGRYATQSAAEAPDLERVIGRRLVPALLDALGARSGGARLAYESHDLTVDGLAGLTEAAAGLELVSLGAAVEDLRAVKDEDEIGLLRQACAIADAALAALLAAGGIRPGRTERAIARDLEGRMLDLGAEAPSFETIVAAGEHSAIPHHAPTDREVQRGDLVKCDFGAAVAGYHSDMTRTFVVGEPAAWQREIYDTVAGAQAAGCAAMSVGAECAAVDTLVRDRIAGAGYADHYPHGLGHGLGLEIHEAPALGAGAAGRLTDRMPVTCEPGIYLEGRGGVRIEDTLVVRTDGPELLTLAPKDFRTV